MAGPDDYAVPADDRLLHTLERLLQLDATELKPTLDQAAQLVAEALRADKVDTFLYEAESATLVAMGTSDTPMGRRQYQIGMHRLPLANDGPAVEVYLTGVPYLTGRADQDPRALKGVVEGLGVRSEMDCPLEVAGRRRGVLGSVSSRMDYFTERDLRFLGAVARWVGTVLHRAELVEAMTRSAAEQGRRAAVEELLTLLTPRQRQIAALIAVGLTNEQIAARLVLSPGTVANHVKHILSRLGAQNRARVASWIAEAGLQVPDSEAPQP